MGGRDSRAQSQAVASKHKCFMSAGEIEVLKTRREFSNAAERLRTERLHDIFWNAVQQEPSSRSLIGSQEFPSSIPRPVESIPGSKVSTSTDSEMKPGMGKGGVTDSRMRTKLRQKRRRWAASTRRSVCAVIVLENWARLSFKLSPCSAGTCNHRLKL